MHQTSPIAARPLRASGHDFGPHALYHERYQGFVARPHAHDYVQVLIPLSGRLSLSANGRSWLVGPEQAALIAPGATHAFTFVDGLVDYLALNTGPDWLDSALQTVSIEPFATGEVRVLRHLGLWLQARQLADELDGEPVGMEAVIAAGLAQISLYLARSMVTSAPEAATDPRIVRAVERLLREYDSDLSIAELAVDAAMSPRHFERRFKDVMGGSPKQFLLDVRITAAKDLLQSTSLPVARVGMQVGFANPSHFSDTFQKLVGQAPSAYRQALTTSA